MPIKTIIFLLISINVSGQQFSEKYNNLAIDAELLLSQKKFLLAATRYSEAFNESNGTGMRMDVYNAAKAWALSNNIDSAFSLLQILADSGSYYSLKNTENQKEFKILKPDHRWKKLLLQIIANKEKAIKEVPPKYKQHFIAGYEVLIDTLIENNYPTLKDSVLNTINADFKKIDSLSIEPKILVFFKTIRFFIDFSNNVSISANYHAGENEDWLLQNRKLVTLTGNIEIPNARNYLHWRKINQPFVILHELSHAYHDKVLGYDYKPIIQAFEYATKSCLYLNVFNHYYDSVYIKKEKAYALTNHKEYFAELTESFLGSNDFYPFNRREFFEYDKRAYRVLKKIWKK